MSLPSILAAAATVPKGLNVGPSENGLPGASTAEGLLSGIIFYALLLIILGFVLSAGLWAVGSFSNNYTQSVNGKKGFMICGGAALALGAAFILISFFYAQGQGVTSTSS